MSNSLEQHKSKWSWGVFFAVVSFVLLLPIATVYAGGLIDLWGNDSSVVGYINTISLLAASLSGLAAYIIRDRENDEKAD